MRDRTVWVCEKTKSMRSALTQTHRTASVKFYWVPSQAPLFLIKNMKKMRPSEALQGRLPVADRKGKWGRAKRGLLREYRATSNSGINPDQCVSVCSFPSGRALPFKGIVQLWKMCIGRVHVFPTCSQMQRQPWHFVQFIWLFNFLLPSSYLKSDASCRFPYN